MLPILPKTRQRSQVETIKATKVPQKRTYTFGIYFLFFGASLLILFQGVPLAFAAMQDQLNNSSRDSILPVSDSFLKQLTETVFIAPGKDYLTAVVDSAPMTAIIDTNYSTEMTISIPKVKINNIKLSPNVPGSDAAFYDAILKKGVAHLKGTPLPGAGGSSVIYGHSGQTGIFGNRNNPQIIFSRLDSVSVGDEITIEKDSNSLQYIVSARKIVVPEDLAFTNEASQKERLILLTCWPLGIGTKRLVIIAERI